MSSGKVPGKERAVKHRKLELPRVVGNGDGETLASLLLTLDLGGLQAFVVAIVPFREILLDLRSLAQTHELAGTPGGLDRIWEK